jgi:predicted aspartyl protease
MTRADVPFRLTDPRRPLLIVPVHVNGRGPYDFLVDTGASRTLIFDALADELGLARGDVVEGHGAGGRLRFALGEARTIAVGDARADAVPVVIGALDVVAQHVDPLPGGVLGYSFLSRFRVLIDYPASRFILEA